MKRIRKYLPMLHGPGAKAEYESYKDMLSDAESFFDAHEITYYQPSSEELALWQQYAASLSDEWKKLVGDDLYKQVSELFNLLKIQETGP